MRSFINTLATPYYDTLLLIEDEITVWRGVRPSRPDAAQKGPCSGIGIAEARVFENHPFDHVQDFALGINDILDGEHRGSSKVLNDSVSACSQDY
jgi:hypothetical protein